MYFVYLMANRHRTVLYTGVTGDLPRRVYEHRHHLLPGFTARYRADRLVYWEAAADIYAAITREKQIKAWRREKKVALIQRRNPDWDDLAAGWFDE